MKQEIYRNYPIGNKVDLVERILERGISNDPERAITKNRNSLNREPGKCCDAGCSRISADISSGNNKSCGE